MIEDTLITRKMLGRILVVFVLMGGAIITVVCLNNNELRHLRQHVEVFAQQLQNQNPELSVPPLQDKDK